MKRPRRTTPTRGKKASARPARRRPDPDARAIETRIRAGEDAEQFLCLDCYCWMLEPAYCLCRERPIW
jgi:hypothetical protein